MRSQRILHKAYLVNFSPEIWVNCYLPVKLSMTVFPTPPILTLQRELYLVMEYEALISPDFYLERYDRDKISCSFRGIHDHRTQDEQARRIFPS